MITKGSSEKLLKCHISNQDLCFCHWVGEALPFLGNQVIRTSTLTWRQTWLHFSFLVLRMWEMLSRRDLLKSTWGTFSHWTWAQTCASLICPSSTLLTKIWPFTLEKVSHQPVWFGSNKIAWRCQKKTDWVWRQTVFFFNIPGSQKIYFSVSFSKSFEVPRGIHKHYGGCMGGTGRSNRPRDG